MKRGFLLLVLIVAAGWISLSYLADLQKNAALRESLDLRLARIDALRASPAYARLIERGEEVCPGQSDQTIWVCGATIRMPAAGYRDTSSRPLCSSPDAPGFIGSFPLPEVTSAEPEALGQRVRPNVPRFGAEGGRYNEMGQWSLRTEDLPALATCDRREGNPCATLWIAGQRGFRQVETFKRDVPDVLERERPLPEVIAKENHPLVVDAFLDLDGRPVAHRVGYPGNEGRYYCEFQVQHPREGYLVGLDLDCAYLDDWRGLLRGILDELSARTIDVAPGARCDVPPLHSRIRPRAHWMGLDQHQAMHDWAADRDAAKEAR